MLRVSLMLALFLGPAIAPLYGGIFGRGKVQLICHRTSNRDMPENTLEALALAARMGCNVVEIDLRRTLDGVIVVNHDGFLERLTSGMGDVELTSSDELNLLDGGAWMGQRFTHMRIPRFDEALQVAREHGVGLILDLKTKDLAPFVLEALYREGMLERVRFGGEWDDIRALYPKANRDPAAGVEPGVTREQVEALHRQGKFVIANFSANDHEMDLPAMRAAVAAGVDALNVDYPRLGADALGRPVEARLAALARTASTGSVQTRLAAIRELSHYDGFPTQRLFERWLLDSNDQISRAAAVALVIARPAAPVGVFVQALSAPEATARRNAAWAIGILHAPAADALVFVLNDKDPEVVKEALLALSRCPGEVSADKLLPFLQNNIPTVRGAAALALAKHQPQVASHAIPELLDREEQAIAQDYAQYVRRGKPKLTQQEIDPIVESYREQMKLIQALELLPERDGVRDLEAQAFRPVEDYSRVTGLVAGYQLWDRIADDPRPAIHALSSSDSEVANRAEWILVKAGEPVLPAVRQALHSQDAGTRERIIRILAWQGDGASLPLLKAMERSEPGQNALLDWAIQKIEMLSFGE